MRRTTRRLLRDLLIVCALVGAPALGFAVWYVDSRHHVHNTRPLGGPQVDVSHVVRIQSEATVAIDPSNPRLLLGGSNDDLYITRVYTSRNGGRRWRSFPGPPLASRKQCGLGDPAVAIATGGHEYYAFLANLTCAPDETFPHLFVANRSGIGAAWHVVAVAQPGGPHFLWDDKPAIAVDTWRGSPHFGRAHLVWSRLESSHLKTLESSYSDDNGRTWSAAVAIGRGRISPITSSVAVASNGAVFVAAADPESGSLWLARSKDGGARFDGVRDVASTRPLAACDDGGFPIPAQAQRCVNANPIVNVLANAEVIVTYESRERNGTQGVFADAFDPHFGRLWHVRVSRPERQPADQFLPTSAIDRAAGVLWTCFYDTTGDPTRKHAWFTCTVSRDGGRYWTAPVRAASVPSDETHADPDQYGDYEGLAAWGGIAHPVWTDERNFLPLSEEIYTSAIPASRLH